MSAVCNNCGSGLSPDATMCATCGSAVSPEAPAGSLGAPQGGPQPPGWGQQPPGWGQQPAPGWRPPPNPADSRNWAMGAHLSALAAFLGIPGFVGPLIIWLVRRNEDAFAGEHGKEALNFNLSVLLYLIIGIVLGIATIGIGFIIVVPLMLVGVVLWLVFTIQAAMRASRGEAYRYPLTIRFIT